MDVERTLKIRLPKGKSAFLWGPRKTGKTFYLGQQFSKSIYYDFLNTDTFFEIVKRPAILREQLLAQPKHLLEKPVILDEVQKIPALLDEVHSLIESEKISFILCGSSARKLVRGHANLLGGRAWRYELFPLVSNEIDNLNLLRALNQGLIPSHYLEKDEFIKTLQSYVQDYLKEEIFNEGLTRNIPAFSRFLDAVGYSHGELVNFANIARDCGIDAKTVKEYYQILVDTLLGSFVEPFKLRQSRDVIGKASKFYLFDVGVAGFLSKRIISEARGEQFGKAFEHFIYMELRAYRSYQSRMFDIHFWRTKSGQEVDFVLGDAEVAIEVKGTNHVEKRDLHGLELFIKDYQVKHAYVVCNESKPRICGKIKVIPWREFLKNLWDNQII